MRKRYIAPTIMLTAGAITSIFNIMNEIAFLDGLRRLLIILIIFYIIGRIVVRAITKFLDNDKQKEIEIISMNDTADQSTVDESVK